MLEHLKLSCLGIDGEPRAPFSRCDGWALTNPSIDEKFLLALAVDKIKRQTEVGQSTHVY